MLGLQLVNDRVEFGDMVELAWTKKRIIEIVPNHIEMIAGPGLLKLAILG